MKEAEFQARKQARIDGIDAEMLVRLKDFAFRRLLAENLPLQFCEKLPHIAVEAVRLGKSIPRPIDLESADKFEFYLREIISSQVDAMLRTTTFEPINQEPGS